MEEAKFKELYKKFLGPREPVAQQNSVIQAVKNDLPGWELAPESKKYSHYFGAQLISVKLQPKNGGQAKLADYKNGKIEIVQG